MCTLTLSRNYTVKYRLLNPLKELVTSFLQQIWNEFRSNESCYVKFSRTEKMLDSFTRLGGKIWNSISPSIYLPEPNVGKLSSRVYLKTSCSLKMTMLKCPALLSFSHPYHRYLHTELFSSTTIIFLRILFLLFIVFSFHSVLSL